MSLVGSHCWSASQCCYYFCASCCCCNFFRFRVGLVVVFAYFLFLLFSQWFCDYLLFLTFHRGLCADCARASHQCCMQHFIYPLHALSCCMRFSLAAARFMCVYLLLNIDFRVIFFALPFVFVIFILVASDHKRKLIFHSVRTLTVWLWLLPLAIASIGACVGNCL